MGRVPTTCLLVLLAWAGVAQGAKTLDLYFIDTEGGQATLVVAPSGQTLLIDAGYTGFGGRYTLRIAAAAKDAGVKKIDYLLITSFQSDSVGGIKNLLEVLPVGTFLDLGAGTGGYPEAYQAGFAKGKHQVVASGDQIPIKGLTVTVLGGGECGGVVVEFGKFRFANLGDGCPQNKGGKVDVMLTMLNGSPGEMAPRIAILNNGPRIGGDAAEWKNMMASPGLEDMWQLHFAMANGAAANVSDALIANLNESEDGSFLKVSAAADGSFAVWNARNKYTRKYGPAR
jgi:competence protein ComEC